MNAQPTSAPPVDNFTGKPRVAIISDIGNEPDDQMSFVRLLLYSNEFDIEAMIAATSTWQKAATHPETMHKLIAAYGEVRGNLQLHAQGWPEAAYLDSRVYAGQPGYGLAVTGEGKSSPGSKALLEAIMRDDTRPLWICLWGGANTLAQALMDLRASKSPEETARLVSRLRVYSISDQDDAGPWIRREFPQLFYIVDPSQSNSDNYSHATWTGISGDIYYRNGEGADTSVVTNEWLDENVRSKGPLGKLYPRFMFIMEGDTPSYLGLIDNGLNAYRHPDWGGWGGRYVYLQPYGETHPIWAQGGDEFARATSQDEVTGVDGRTHVSDQATIWRWREAFQNDFAARMDWTVKDFAHANHNPQVVVNGQSGTGVIEISAKAGQTITLDASGTTDPDHQSLTYQWFLYPEAGLTGTHGADVSLSGGDGPIATVLAKSACRPMWLPGIPCHGPGVMHVIVAVTDNGSPRLTSYRRIIVTVNGAE
ncbi:MAG TPA: nucleoside hydrolase-like domain-containing protein [Terracidiphilus sp.]|nr:nucleoside hydrolase-like domain-containing protein [Terracidiphilus sp.]